MNHSTDAAPMIPGDEADSRLDVGPEPHPHDNPADAEWKTLKKVLRASKQGQIPFGETAATGAAGGDASAIGQEWLPLHEAAWRLGVTRHRAQEYASNLLPDDRWYPEHMSLLQSMVDYPAQIRVRFGAILAVHHQAQQHRPRSPLMLNSQHLDPAQELQALDRELTALEEHRQNLVREIDSLGFLHTEIGDRRRADRRGPDDRRGPVRGSAGRRASGPDRRAALETRHRLLGTEMSRLVESIDVLSTRRALLRQAISDGTAS